MGVNTMPWLAARPRLGLEAARSCQCPEYQSLTSNMRLETASALAGTAPAATNSFGRPKAPAAAVAETKPSRRRRDRTGTLIVTYGYKMRSSCSYILTPPPAATKANIVSCPARDAGTRYKPNDRCACSRL